MRRNLRTAIVGRQTRRWIGGLGSGKRVPLHCFVELAVRSSKGLSSKQRQTNDSVDAKFSDWLVHPVYLLTSPASVGRLRQTHPAQQVSVAGIGAYAVPRHVGSKIDHAGRILFVAPFK